MGFIDNEFDVAVESDAKKSVKDGMGRASLFVIAAALIASKANAQSSSSTDQVNLSSLEGVAEVRRLDDGSVELIMDNGDVIALRADQVTIQGGEVFASQALLGEVGSAGGFANWITSEVAIASIAALAIGGTVAGIAAASDGGSDAVDAVPPTPPPAAPNSAPVFTSDATASFAENGTEAIIDVSATDADGDTVNFAISGGADADLFTIDETTGALSFAAAPDFEAPSDADGDNLFDVVVEASDGTDTTTQTIAITVTNLNDNAPTFSSDPAASVEENNVSTGFTAVADDLDGDSIVFEITGGADADLFVIDAATGAVSFAEAPDFEAPSDADGDNVFDIIVGASDGENTTTQTVTITLTDANDNAPIFTSPVAVTVAENETDTGLIVAATDADGDAVSFSITGGADAALFAIDAESGALSFLSAPDFETPGDADGDNSFDLVVTASDGANTTDQFITVDVADVFEAAPAAPVAPGIASLTPSPSEGGVSVGRLISVTFTEPIDAATITPETFSLTVAGDPVEGTLSVSPDGFQATFTPSEILPSSSRATINIDGSQILTLDGDPIDADGDGADGGLLQTTFDTLNLSSIEGTTVSGVIFDSNTLGPDGENIPIEGVLVSVEGRPDLFAVTDENGQYTIEDVPAPTIFVIIDTTDAISPDGFSLAA